MRRALGFEAVAQRRLLPSAVIAVEGAEGAAALNVITVAFVHRGRLRIGSR
jgi:hypothetical protein